MKSCLGENMVFLFGENVTFLTFFVAFDDKNMCLLLKGFGWDLLRIIIIWHLKWSVLISYGPVVQDDSLWLGICTLVERFCLSASFTGNF